VNASLASDQDDRRLTFGICVFFGTNLVSLGGPRNQQLEFVPGQKLSINVFFW